MIDDEYGYLYRIIIQNNLMDIDHNKYDASFNGRLYNQSS